ncbi:hypothetical protein [Streptomyces sp. NPDC020983]|uniref:hypothetical protein n=1 Tax=Streptomyces sp. NPDC020983 TaxID=3365106 RepID=UPI0037A460C9
MRVGSAAAAAVAVLCAAVTAADGAAAVAAGPPLAKSEAEREIGAAYAREGLLENDRVIVLVDEKWTHGRPPPPQCVISRTQPMTASREQTARVVADLARDGWRVRGSRDDGSFWLTTLFKGGWRLSLSWLPPDPDGRLFADAVRPGC